MKFKVGDRVRFIKSIWSHSCRVEVGEVYKIKNVDKGSEIPYQTETNFEWFKEEELERAEYTYEDLKKSPIGTKITFENRKLFVKNGEDKFESPNDFIYIDDFKSLTNCEFGKIIKIEEPEYKTVYESKPEILDETEKRYLRNFITPFKDSIETIRRLYSPTKKKDYIQIRYRDDRPTNFPYFESNTMYKGMELNKNYSLEELGL